MRCARCIEALRGLFDRYGLVIPENPWPGEVTRYASLREACEAGMAAEIENGALDERLLASTRRPNRGQRSLAPARAGRGLRPRWS